MKQKTLSFILFLVLLGGLFWYVNKNYLNPQSAISGQPGTISKNSREFLVFVDRSSFTSIYRLENLTKKIYTDADESSKIIKVGSIIDNNKLPLVTNNKQDAESGNLELLDLKTQKKELIQKDFKKPLIFDVANAGQTVAYVLFSNIEENYGYNLYLGDKIILNKSTNIRAVKFSKDAKKIAIACTDGLNGQILIYSVQNGEIKTQKSIDNKLIDSVSWTSDDELLFSSRGIASNKSELNKLDKDNNIQELTTAEGGIINFIFADSAFNNIGYIIAQYDKITDDSTKGQIFIYNIKEGSKRAIGKGTQIVGWMKGD